MRRKRAACLRSESRAGFPLLPGADETDLAAIGGLHAHAKRPFKGRKEALRIGGLEAAANPDAGDRRVGHHQPARVKVSRPWVQESWRAMSLGSIFSGCTLN
jgi:hypothetical protein